LPTSGLAKSSATGTRTSEQDPDQVNQVLKWILSGASERDVTEAVTNCYQTTDPQPLILAALHELRQAADADPQTIRGFCIEAVRDLYRRMLEIGDFTGALRAVKQLSEMAS
jgi:hypothetical protein